MVKRLFHVPVFVFLFCLPGLLCGCSPQPTDRFVIGISIPTQREEGWIRGVNFLRAEAAKRGYQVKLQISDNDATRQLAQCENLIAQGVQVLVVAPHDASAASVIVDKAHRAGIKVISYDRMIKDAAVDLYLSYDNEKVGELQGAYLTRKVPKGNYIVLSGAPTDNNAAQFKAGAMKFIKPLAEKGEIRIVMEQAVKDWLPAEAMKLVENALTSSKNRIDAILAPNDGTAGGAIAALAAQKLDGKVPVTGQDSEASAARRIMEGKQSMTVFKDASRLAEETIIAARKLADGADPGANNTVFNGRYQIPARLLTPVVVDRNNLETVLIESGYLKRSDVAVAGK
ncbi:MAG: sugar ABC transporter substrate-binding protein [Geobacter sp.]|jgi:D-xylose transport system substrate-binding protein|nr:sugar ABC transporter substrate-binding protein [Geobacter sp.]